MREVRRVDLDNSRAVERQRRLALPVAIAALAVVPVLVLQESQEVPQAVRTAATVIDWLIWGVFLFEIVATTVAAGDRAGWLRSHVLDVAIVALSVPLTSILPALRAVRVLRLLRLLRLPGLARTLFSPTGVRYASFLALLTVLGGGEAFAEAEHHSLGEGVYWAATSITTVGYGDFAPLTSTGRAIAVVVMVVGIGFVAILTGAIAERFVSRDVRALEADETKLLETLLRVEAAVAEVSGRLAELERRTPR